MYIDVCVWVYVCMCGDLDLRISKRVRSYRITNLSPTRLCELGYFKDRKRFPRDTPSPRVSLKSTKVRLSSRSKMTGDLEKNRENTFV